MSSKIVLALVVLSGISLGFSAPAEARGRGCGCYGSSEVYYSEKTQAVDGSRFYSYEPGDGYYMGRGSSTRRSVPLYSLPKSDSRKYDAR